MSDKTYWLNKHIKRQYAKSDFIRADGGGAPSWVSTVSVVGIALLIMGLFSYFMQGKAILWLIIAIAGGVVGLGVFLYGRIKGAKAYSEFIYRYEDKEYLFQYIGKKHIVFACEGKIFEFKKREVNVVDTIYRPENSLNAITEVLYTTKTRKGENVIYSGEEECEVNGKKKVNKYKVKLGKENKIESYTVNGCEMMFYTLKKGEQKLAMPINLYNAIRDAGIELPGEELITLVYNY